MISPQTSPGLNLNNDEDHPHPSSHEEPSCSNKTLCAKDTPCCNLFISNGTSYIFFLVSSFLTLHKISIPPSEITESIYHPPRIHLL